MKSANQNKGEYNTLPDDIDKTKRDFDFVDLGYKTNIGLLKLGKSIFWLFISLDHSFIDEVMKPCYPRGWRKYVPRLFVFILFFKELLGKTYEEMLGMLCGGNGFLRKGKDAACITVGWALYAGVNSSLPDESQISNFKKKVGEGRINYCFNILAAQILEKVEAESITDEEALELAIKELKRKRRRLEKVGDYYGVELLVYFMDSIGLIQKIAECMKEDKERGYSVRSLVIVYLCRAPLGIKNNHKLSKVMESDVMKKIGGFTSKVPCNRTLDYNSDFDPDRIDESLEELALNIQKLNKKEVTIAIDSTMLPVWGKYVGARKTKNHDNGKYQKCYKLYVVFDVAKKNVLFFELVHGKKYDGHMLTKLKNKAQRMLGAENIDVILYDRGFWSGKEYNKIDKYRKQVFNTPAKKVNTVKDAEKDILKNGKWKRVSELEKKLGIKKNKCKQRKNEWIAETEVELDEFEGKLRMIVIRKRGIVKDKDGKKREGVVLHSYLTNNRKITALEVYYQYRKRWGIENLFKELKNQWHLKAFSHATKDGARSHIGIVLIMYNVVNQFKKAIGGRYENADLDTLKFGIFKSGVVLVRTIIEDEENKKDDIMISDHVAYHDSLDKIDKHAENMNLSAK